MLYGDVAFTGVEDTNTEAFMWIPIFGPLTGGVIAAITYYLLISAHWPRNQDAVFSDNQNLRNSHTVY